jgi:L-ascorbate metabolism protein UlaG (beta-lactamase superfamily)
MKLPWIAALLVLSLCSCSTYQPLKDKHLYSGPRHASQGPGVTVTYFGNTTILISDGTTNLLVDGFFSRPGALRTLFWTIEPNKRIIQKQLTAGKIERLDAVLVGHAHHDHALDSAIVAKETGAVVVGPHAYEFIHRGAGTKANQERLVVVPCDGLTKPFGKFTVRFRRSAHANPHNIVHRSVMGDIHADVRPPTRFTNYQCGEVFALHIRHTHGQIAITTTAGASKGQFAGLDADVVMLGVGVLGKEPKYAQDLYWKETVGALHPHTVIPVHWDAFTSKLRKDLRAPGLTVIDEVKKAMAVVQSHRTKEAVMVMNLRDSFRLRNGVIQPSLEEGRRQ